MSRTPSLGAARPRRTCRPSLPPRERSVCSRRRCCATHEQRPGRSSVRRRRANPLPLLLLALEEAEAGALPRRRAARRRHRFGRIEQLAELLDERRCSDVSFFGTATVSRTARSPTPRPCTFGMPAPAQHLIVPGCVPAATSRSTGLVERRHADARAQRRLREGQRHLACTGRRRRARTPRPARRETSRTDAPAARRRAPPCPCRARAASVRRRCPPAR